jgi:hypothetical protein
MASVLVVLGGFKNAVRSDEVARKGLRRIVHNLIFKFVVVFLVSYPGRWMEHRIGAYHIVPSTERFLVTFLANFWFIALWFLS